MIIRGRNTTWIDYETYKFFQEWNRVKHSQFIQQYFMPTQENNNLPVDQPNQILENRIGETERIIWHEIADQTHQAVYATNTFNTYTTTYTIPETMLRHTELQEEEVRDYSWNLKQDTKPELDFIPIYLDHIKA